MAHPLLRLARDVLKAHLNGTPWSNERDGEPPHGWDDPARGCFVSLKTLQGGLRGCIGTVLPVKQTLADEVAANAIAAATRDPRFPPVQPGELPSLHLSIDLLSPLEDVADPHTLDPAVYGVVVRSGGRQGVLLPDLPQVRTWREQVGICRDKAGIAPGAEIEIQRFTVERLVEPA